MSLLRLPQGSRYTSQSLPDGSTRIEVVPATQFGLLKSIVVYAVICSGVIGSLSESIVGGLMSLAVFYGIHWLLMRFAPWNRGRRLSVIVADRQGLQLEDGRRIGRADIAELQLVSPRATETVFHSGWSQGGGFGNAISIKPGLAAGLAARSWRLELTALGEKHVLAGGMEEVTARSVLHEIGKTFG